MLSSLFGNGIWGWMLIPLRLLALTVHECSHGYVSTKLGDPTPRVQGRLSINPLVHLDLMGTILMLLTGFGWAKPVEVNPMYYKDRKKGMALVAFAGPLSNLLLAFLSRLIYSVFYIAVVSFDIGVSNSLINTVEIICSYSAQVNLCFMVFNLIPIPPLDGSRILGMFLSNRAYYTLMQYERYSLILIMFLSLTGMLDSIIGGGVSFIYGGIIEGLQSLTNILLGWKLG